MPDELVPLVGWVIGTCLGLALLAIAIWVMDYMAHMAVHSGDVTDGDLYQV